MSVPPDYIRRKALTPIDDFTELVDILDEYVHLELGERLLKSYNPMYTTALSQVVNDLKEILGRVDGYVVTDEEAHYHEN